MFAYKLFYTDKKFLLNIIFGGDNSIEPYFDFMEQLKTDIFEDKRFVFRDFCAGC